MFWNIWREKRGKLAATMERQKVFAAMAEAALSFVRRLVPQIAPRLVGVLTT
jgi:hypothetical protein